MREITGVSFFHTPTVAKILQEVAVDSVKTSSGSLLLSRWYQAGQVASLNLWTTPEGKILRQKFEILGQLVIWDKDSGLRTGLLVDHEVTGEKPVYDPSVNLYSVMWAREIVDLTEALPDSFKKQILNHWAPKDFMAEKKAQVLSLFKVGKKKG